MLETATHARDGPPASALGNSALLALVRRAAARPNRERDEREADHAADRIVTGGARADAPPGVRIHTSGRAADAAKALHAKAFTVGHDIAFDSGRFTPETPKGQRLLAHELAHVAQQEVDGPRLQCNPDGDEDFNPPYLRGLDSRIRDQIDRRLKRFAEVYEDIEVGPLSKIREKYPPNPYAENAEIEIPARDWNQPFTLWSFDENSPDEEQHSKFRLHQRLAGGYELLDVHGARGEKVILARGDMGYVVPDWLFSEMFRGYQELEEPVIYRHEHPGTVFLYDFGMQFLPAATAFMLGNPEIGLCTMETPFVWEGETLTGAAVPEESLLSSEGEALTATSIADETLVPSEAGQETGGACLADEPAPSWEGENTEVEVQPLGVRPGEGTLSFASDEAWLYDGRVVRVVNTPDGPRAFYQRTGEGGEFFMGAQPGDWVPFEGFQPQRFGAHLVKPFGTSEPATPLTLYRWGTEENAAINSWIQTQPEALPVDVGEGWGLIQQRLQELGVPVRYPIAD